MQAEYEPYRQLIEAIQERVAIVRATADTNFPPFMLEQAWTVDAGKSNQVIEAGQIVNASGFPEGNGMYEWDAISGYYLRDDGLYAIAESGGWMLDYEPPFFGLYYSATGPGSESWYESTPGDLPDARTVLWPAQTNILLLTDSVITTNAVGPFVYQYTDPNGLHTATGFPHLTYHALGYLDTVIGGLLPYYLRSDVIDARFWTNSMDVADWRIDNMTDALGLAGVGGTYTNISETATNVVRRFTRQPEIDTSWLLAEWTWDGSVWDRNMQAEYDVRVLDHSLMPVAQLHTTGSVVAVSLELVGTALSNLWQGVTQPTYDASESVGFETSAPVTLTNRWYSIDVGSGVSGVPPSTGDYVTVRYSGPVILFGNRPYRLYASDLDERAAVLSELRWTAWEHPVDWAGRTGWDGDYAWQSGVYEWYTESDPIPHIPFTNFTAVTIEPLTPVDGTPGIVWQGRSFEESAGAEGLYRRRGNLLLRATAAQPYYEIPDIIATNDVHGLHIPHRAAGFEIVEILDHDYQGSPWDQHYDAWGYTFSDRVTNETYASFVTNAWAMTWDLSATNAHDGVTIGPTEAPGQPGIEFLEWLTGLHEVPKLGHFMGADHSSRGWGYPGGSLPALGGNDYERSTIRTILQWDIDGGLRYR